HSSRQKSVGLELSGQFSHHRNWPSRFFWPPSLSKFDGSSHASNAARNAGHSLSIIGNQAVFRFKPPHLHHGAHTTIDVVSVRKKDLGSQRLVLQGVAQHHRYI